MKASGLKKTWPLLAALALLAALSPGAARAAGADLGRLLAEFKTIQSLRAEFTQTRSLPLLKFPVESRGSLRYQAPGRLRWEYQAPHKGLFLMNGRHLRRYLWSKGGWAAAPGDPGPMLGRFLEEMVRWFKGDFESGGLFMARLEETAEPVISLQPRNDLRGVLRGIELTLGKSPGEISQVVIREQEGDVLTIKFHNLRINQPLPPDTFSPPVGGAKAER